MSLMLSNGTRWWLSCEPIQITCLICLPLLGNIPFWSLASIFHDCCLIYPSGWWFQLLYAKVNGDHAIMVGNTKYPPVIKHGWKIPTFFHGFVNGILQATGWRGHAPSHPNQPSPHRAGVHTSAVPAHARPLGCHCLKNVWIFHDVTTSASQKSDTRPGKPTKSY